MKLDFFFRVSLGLLLLFGGFGSLAGQDLEGPNEKAARYHSLLVKKPGNTMVFNRFVDAWLDTGSKKGLTGWLEGEAKKGGAADWRILGALHQYLGEDEAALRALNEAVERDEKDAALRLARAKIQARLLAFEAALLDLNLAADEEETAIEASKLKGLYLARSGQVDDAVKAWKKVIAAFPQDEGLREDLIELEVREGLYQEAMEASRALVEMTRDPYKKALRRLRLGDLQMMAGDRESGLKTYEEIMTATGEGTWLEREVLAQIERVFMKEDDVKGLRDYYQKLRERYPRRVSIRKVLARQMALNAELEEAIALFREVLKITPGDLGNREGFIAFLEVNEKWTEAKEELQSLLELRKKDALLWKRLARLEGKLNNEDGLQAALGKVAELRKETPGGLLATVVLYDQAELADEAEALLREGRVAFPDSFEVKEGLASFLMRNKKEEEALALWKAMAMGADRGGLLRVTRSLKRYGKGGLAFDLLGNRLADFDDDPIVLTSYCKLAATVEEAGEALPQGLALVRLAGSPTELESSVRTMLRLLSRAEKREEMRKSLAERDDLKVGVQCLLAAIHADLGDTRTAAELLKKAEEAPGGTLARFYRVSFEENRGNLEKAIEIMRAIVATPEGRKTVHFRRLVNLLERLGDFGKALAAVEDWKRIAPGDEAAWRQRARLLQADDQADEAVVELRRMIGKFGADEERRATLAAALVEAGEDTRAFRVYDQLYSEAERLDGKLRWAGEMARLAESEGKLDELLQDFDRRKRSNPRAVAPLLALAEIHRVLNQYEERRSALLEASRRRPDDIGLLTRIAEVEERAGEYERAVGILRDAVKRDKTSKSKRLLASLLMKNGEVQKGLDLLVEIPGAVNDPRGLEGIVQALVSARENEKALVFLEQHLDKHESDWRLHFLKAVILKWEDRNEEAFEMFATLLKGGEEISGLKRLVAPNAVPLNMGPFKALFEMNGWDELSLYRSFVSDQSSRRSGQVGRSAISLPGTPRELQVLSLLEGSFLMTEIPGKDNPQAREAFSLPGIKDAGVFALMEASEGGPASVEILTKRVEEDPENVGLLALSLAMKAFTQGTITDEEFTKAEEIMREEYPGVFGTVLFSAMMSSKLSSERLADAVGKLVESLPEEEASEAMGLLSIAVFSPFAGQMNVGRDLTAIKKVMAEWVLTTEEAPTNWHWMPSVVPYLLGEDKVDDALTLLNRHCKWQAQSKNPAPVGGMMQMMSMGGSPFGNEYLVPPSLPPTELKGVPADFLRIFPVNPEKEASDEKAQLLARLQAQDGKGTASNPAEALGDRVKEIGNPALRALVFLARKEEEAARKLIEEMLASREESSLLFAAGYFFDQGDPRSYDALLRLRMLPLSRESRKKVDGHLAIVGSSFGENEKVEIDLEPARRAALRLRRFLGGNERETLQEVLVKLGLDKEAKRLAAVAKPAVPQVRVARRSNGSRDERIAELRKKGNIEGAAREAARRFRTLVGQNSGSGNFNDYEMREFLKVLSENKLKEKTLEKLDPGESESKKRLLEFAIAQQLMGTSEKARELFNKLLEKDPDLTAAKIGVVENTPFEEIEPDKLVVMKGGTIEVNDTGLVFDALWESARSGDGMDYAIRLCQLTARFLETLPPSGEASRNLSWVPYRILAMAQDDRFGSRKLESLITSDNGMGMGFIGGIRGYSRRGGDSDIDKKATKGRNEAVEAVFVEMLKHPQIAEQGFMLLEAAREGLELTSDDLSGYARQALGAMLEDEVSSTRIFGLWARYTGNSSTSSGDLADPTGPLLWLLGRAAKNGGEILTPELAAKMEKAWPEDYARMNQARALAMAGPAEAQKIFETWKGNLAVGKRAAARMFARQILLFSPKPGRWAGELEKLMVEKESRRMGMFMDEDSAWPSLAREWGAWRLKSEGSQAYEKFLLRLFEANYGPSEKWEILAELGADDLPQQYEYAIYSFRKVIGALLNEVDLAKATLLFLSGYPLDSFVEGLSREVAQVWEVAFDSKNPGLRKNLLSPEAEAESASPRQFFVVAQSGFPTRISLNENENFSKQAGEALLKEKGLDPFLQKVAAASLMGTSDGRAVMASAMEENLELIKRASKESPERSYELFQRWFPEMEKAEVSEPLQQVFAESAKEARARE